MNANKIKTINLSILLLVLTACGGDFDNNGTQSSGSRLRSTSSSSSGGGNNGSSGSNGNNGDNGSNGNSGSNGNNTNSGSGIPNMNGFGSLSTSSSSSSSSSSRNSSSSSSNTSSNASESPDTFNSKGESNSNEALLTPEEEAALDRANAFFPEFIRHLGACAAIAARDGFIAPSWHQSLILWRDGLVKYEEWAIYLRDNRKYTGTQWGKISLFYNMSYYSRALVLQLLTYPVR